jgi:peptide/nickel transport system substrate-binding protein
MGDQNVWALFSGEQYSYNDYAVRAHYWPRLYDLSIPEQNLEPRVAADMPTSVRQEGAFYTASVPIRTDLRWSDASPFSAQDVAFTVNAALQFGLGFDWADFYDERSLDHAEALSADTVKFFFTTQPGVDAWQLGALQGPVVQAAYWAPKVAEAAALLPSPETRAKIETLQKEAAGLQNEVNRLYTESLTAQGPDAREVQASLRRQQGNLDEATNALAAEKAGLETALSAARQALFRQDDSGEPLLGPWLPVNDSVSLSGRANRANEAYPGARPNYDRAAYVLFPSADAAAESMQAGEVNLVLNPTPEATSAAAQSMISPARSPRFLVLNVNSSGLGDLAVRTALACMIDQTELAKGLGAAVELTSVIPEQETAWHDPKATLPCAGQDAPARLASASNILRSAGYSWVSEPSPSQPGQGLKRPDGGDVPPMTLLAPSSDEQRAEAGVYIAERAAALGIPLRAQIVAPDALDYAVFSSGDFDAAVLGWRVGSYPGYLCDWFNADGIFHYSPSVLPSACGELQASSDLQDARVHAYAMQEALVAEMPLIPLFSVAITDGLQGVGYPFPSVMDGLAGVYGAPELAFPKGP